MAADDEAVELLRDDRRLRQPGRAPAAEPDAAAHRRSRRARRRQRGESYWDRDERHDLAVSLNRGRPALDALCRVLERWIAHFLGVEVDRSGRSARSTTAAGSGTSASTPRRQRLLNDLYNRVEVDDERMGRLLCLFELDFADPADMRPAIAGRPGLPRDGDGRRPATEAEAAEPPSQPAARHERNDDLPQPPIRTSHPRRRASRWRCSPSRRRPPGAGAPAQAHASAAPARRCQRAAATPASPSLAPLAWLAGCWRGSVNQRDFREHWMPLRGGLMVGASHTVIGEKTQSFEYLRIESRPDGIFYVVAPSGAEARPPFRLTGETSDGEDAGSSPSRNPAQRFPADDHLPARQRRAGCTRTSRASSNGADTQGHLSDAPRRLRDRRNHREVTATPVRPPRDRLRLPPAPPPRQRSTVSTPRLASASARSLPGSSLWPRDPVPADPVARD